MDIQVKDSKKLKELLNSKITEDTNIIIESGEYSIVEPIEIKNNSYSLEIVGNGEVKINGAKRISSKWETFNDKIVMTEIEKGLDIQELFVNDKKYVMCRYPNYVEDEKFNGTAADAISPERVKNWSNPIGGYVRSLHKREWGGNSYRIVGVNDNYTLKLEWVGDNNRGSDIHTTVLMVENIFEELDTEFEWFYDKVSGKLFVIPENGVDLNDCKVECSVNSDIIKIIDAKNITIKNIIFEKTNRTLFNSDYIQVTRSDWGLTRRGVLYFENTENINVIDCKFQHIGGNAIFVDGKNRNGTISNCDFCHTGASGIIIHGNQSCVRDLSTWEEHKTSIKDFKVGPIGDEYSENIKVESCYFYDTGIYEKQSAPISLSVAYKITLKGNTIHRTPRAGINICDGSFGGHLIEDNLIFDTVRETGDHGPFNSWGRDRFWSYKNFDTNGYCGDIKKPYALLDAMDTTIINHNMIIGKQGFGIDLDDGSTNYTITNNYCNGVGIKLREGFYRTVKNNLIINAPLDLHCTYAGNDDNIENNVIVYPLPLNIIILNEGFTTRFDNNLLIGGEPTALDTPIIKTGKNIMIDNIDGDKLDKMQFDEFIEFKAFTMDFGVEGKPKPEVPKAQTVAGVKKVKIAGLAITDVNESIRSVGGLPGYDGVFVEDIESWSHFRQVGVREKDTILELNGKIVKNINEFINTANSEKVIITVKIIRNQIEQALERKFNS